MLYYVFYSIAADDSSNKYDVFNISTSNQPLGTIYYIIVFRCT